MSVTLRKRKLPSGKINLYLDIYYNGHRKYEALKLGLNGDRFLNRETLKIAEAIRAKRELDMQTTMHGLTSTSHLKESFVGYLRKLAEKSISPRTKQSWTNAINHLTKFAGENILFGDLTRDFFEDFKLYLLKEVSQNSAHKYFMTIKCGINHALKNNVITYNPISFITIKKRETLPKFLTLDEIQKLASTPCGNETVKIAFLFSCFTGLRYSDVLDLTWHKISNDQLEFLQRKTNHFENIPLSKQALNLLQQVKKTPRSSKIPKEFPDETVFFMPRQSTTHKLITRWASAAGLNKKISFHCARHSFATLSLTYGNDLYTTSKLLGHRDLRTTEIYARVIDEKKKIAVAKLPEIELSS